MDFIQTFIPTSKAQLIQVAMWYHRGDTQKAQQMVDFYTSNMPNLPDTEPIQPTFFQQATQSAKGFYQWVKENQGDLVQGYQVIQSIIQNKGILPTQVAESVVEELPRINEEV